MSECKKELLGRLNMHEKIKISYEKKRFFSEFLEQKQDGFLLNYNFWKSKMAD